MTLVAPFLKYRRLWFVLSFACVSSHLLVAASVVDNTVVLVESQSHVDVSMKMRRSVMVQALINKEHGYILTARHVRFCGVSTHQVTFTGGTCL